MTMTAAFVHKCFAEAAKCTFVICLSKTKRFAISHCFEPLSKSDQAASEQP